MALSSTQARASDPRMWIVTLAFLSCITVGGVFLVQYITLPETHENSSHAVIGLVLVAVPWFFWFMTFLYRLLWKTQMVGDEGPPPTKAGAAAPSSETNGAARDIEAGSSTDSGNGREGEEEDHQGGFGDSNLSKGSSRHSHESEVPLASAMAS